MLCRIAGKRIGRAKCHRIERAADRDTEPLEAVAAEILNGRRKARGHDAQRRRHATAPTNSLTGSTRSTPSDARVVKPVVFARRHWNERHFIAPAPAVPSGSDASHSGIGHRPMICQPQGVSSGNTQDIRPAIASEPAGMLVRGEFQPIERQFGGDVAHIGLAGQEAEHIDVVDRPRCAVRRLAAP